MKYTCHTCQKIVSEKNAIKIGWLYACSEKCKDNLWNWKKNPQLNKSVKIIGILLLLYIVSIILSLYMS